MEIKSDLIEQYLLSGDYYKRVQGLEMVDIAIQNYSVYYRQVKSYNKDGTRTVLGGVTVLNVPADPASYGIGLSVVKPGETYDVAVGKALSALRALNALQKGVLLDNSVNFNSLGKERRALFETAMKNNLYEAVSITVKSLC